MGVTVSVLVAVSAGVSVFTGVAVGVFVYVAVTEAVFVGVTVGVTVAVSSGGVAVCVLVGVAAGKSGDAGIAFLPHDDSAANTSIAAAANDNAFFIMPPVIFRDYIWIIYSSIAALNGFLQPEFHDSPCRRQ